MTSQRPLVRTDLLADILSIPSLSGTPFAVSAAIYGAQMIETEATRSGEMGCEITRTVLYVDDHAVDLMLMRALLSQRPAWRLNMACDGQAAWTIARSQPHDLLLLDLELPDGHGTELLRRLRSIPGLADVPAVAVTAQNFNDLSDIGFCEIWTKPLNLMHILRRLHHFLADPANVADS